MKEASVKETRMLSSIDMYRLKAGDRVELEKLPEDEKRIEAEVVAPSEDGRWIMVRFLEGPGAGGLDLVEAEEIEQKL